MAHGVTEKSFCENDTLLENTITKSTFFKSSKNNEKDYEKLLDTAFTKDGEVTVARWNDASVENLQTNWDVVEPPVNEKRFSRTERENINVSNHY